MLVKISFSVFRYKILFSKVGKKLEKELEETNEEISEKFTDATLDRYSY